MRTPRVDAGAMLRDGDAPTLTVGLAAVLLANVASTILSIAYATTLLGQTVSFLLVNPVFTTRIAVDRGGVLRGYVVVAVCVIVGQLLLRALLGRWVVASAGASVGFGRALMAFVVSDLLAAAGSGVWSSLGTRAIWVPLDWIGIAVAVLVLCSGAPRRVASESATTYVRPPDAPGDWPF
jgi:hypothetical protein